MKKFIVTTTINPPTEALKKYQAMEGWELIIAGDLKTPHREYLKYNYLSPEYQEQNYPELSRLIGWNCIQRRNFAMIEAYQLGADIIALVDDDNIPYPQWGQNLSIGKEVLADYYETENEVFDPLSVTNYPHLWHRGYPIELLPTKNNIIYKGKKKVKPLIQADLWDGDPDIDAICRIAHHPCVKFNVNNYFFSNKISPFNSQNTFLAREVFPDYFLFPNIGRMDDIWASYMMKYPVVYAPASVYQERNQHNLIKDMVAELIGYENNLKFIKSEKPECFIDQKIYNIYRSYFK